MRLKTPHSFGRHGEIILKKIDCIPEEARLKNKGRKIIIGHSETGHHHVLTIPQTEGAEIEIQETTDGRYYINLPRNGTLTHVKTDEQHQTQVFEQGMYVRIIRKSYSYAERMMRRVQD